MTNVDRLPFGEFDILEADECARIRDQVIALRPHWTPRSQSEFFTLGAASYLDAPKDHSDYLKAAENKNPLLEKSFGKLYFRLKDFFERQLKNSVCFERQYALPGFHVFEFDGRDRRNDIVAYRAHFDLQWVLAIPGLEPMATLSFTLPIEEPSGGASLEIWHLRYKEAVELGLSASEYALNHAPQVVRYVRGRMVVVDGLSLHAIGGSREPAPRGFRITLQGHGVLLPQGWLLYW